LLEGGGKKGLEGRVGKRGGEEKGKLDTIGLRKKKRRAKKIKGVRGEGKKKGEGGGGVEQNVGKKEGNEFSRKKGKKRSFLKPPPELKKGKGKKRRGSCKREGRKVPLIISLPNIALPKRGRGKIWRTAQDKGKKGGRGKKDICFFREMFLGGGGGGGGAKP